MNVMKFAIDKGIELLETAKGNTDKANLIVDLVKERQLAIDNFSVTVEHNENVILNGTVKNEATRELMVSTIGDIKGISSVEDRLTIG